MKLIQGTVVTVEEPKEITPIEGDDVKTCLNISFDDMGGALVVRRVDFREEIMQVGPPKKEVLRITKMRVHGDELEKYNEQLTAMKEIAQDILVASGKMIPDRKVKKSKIQDFSGKPIPTEAE